MKWILAAIFMFLPGWLLAQNADNFLDFTLNSGAVVGFNTSSSNALDATGELEGAQTVPNSFYLSCMSKTSNCRVYVSVPAGISTNTSTSMATSNFHIKFNHTDCPAGDQMAVTTAEVTLSSSNQQLFQKKAHNNSLTKWYYDFKVPALGYNFAPGNYYCTLQFTMTQP